MHRRLALAAAVLLLSSACFRRDRYEDEGYVCVASEVDPWNLWEENGDQQPRVTIAEGDTAPLTVVISECESGSVDWPELSCTAVLEGDRLVVEPPVACRPTTPLTKARALSTSATGV